MNSERYKNLNFSLPLLDFKTFIEIRDMAKPSPMVLDDEADSGPPPPERFRWRILRVNFEILQPITLHYCQNQWLKPYPSYISLFTEGRKMREAWTWTNLRWGGQQADSRDFRCRSFETVTNDQVWDQEKRQNVGRWDHVGSCVSCQDINHGVFVDTYPQYTRNRVPTISFGKFLSTFLSLSFK